MAEPWIRESAQSFVFVPSDYPEAPGCYLMYASSGALLYVGKAINLRRRLASYFRTSSKPHRKAEMIQRIARITVFLVRNEREALVLESNLIRHHKPRYNSRFTRTGDSYYYIALSDEPIPRLVPYRMERVNFALQDIDGRHTRLFGPYIGWRLRNHLLKTLADRNRLRTCHSLPAKACLRYPAGLCHAPCVQPADGAVYRTAVRSAVRILESPPKRLVTELEQEMRSKSAQLAFDEAAALRDAMRALNHASLPQVVELPRDLDANVFWVENGLRAALSVRNGRTIELRFASPDDPMPSFNGTQGPLRTIANTLSLPHSATSAPNALRVTVPKTRRSDIGQLLELCRINHVYERARRVAHTSDAHTSDNPS